MRYNPHRERLSVRQPRYGDGTHSQSKGNDSLPSLNQCLTSLAGFSIHTDNRRIFTDETNHTLITVALRQTNSACHHLANPRSGPQTTSTTHGAPSSITRLNNRNATIPRRHTQKSSARTLDTCRLQPEPTMTRDRRRHNRPNERTGNNHCGFAGSIPTTRHNQGGAA